MKNNAIQKQLNDLKHEKNRIEEEINKIYHILFADYLNNELELNKHKSELYYNSKYIQIPWELASKIHQWIYDNNIDLHEYNFNGVYIKVFDDHYAAVHIRFENKEIENDFLKTFNLSI